MPRSVEAVVVNGRVVLTERGEGTVPVGERQGPGGLAGPLVDFERPARWAVVEGLEAAGVAVTGEFDSPCG